MATRGRPPKQETLVARAAVEMFREAQGVLPGQSGKQVLQPRAKYDAAGQGRRLAGWNPPSSGPNRAIEGLQTIRNRSRDSSRNDWSGSSATQKWVTNLIGIGITPRFKRITSPERKSKLQDLWADFVQVCDADCVLNYYGLQTLGTRSLLDAGEVFVRRRARFESDGLPVPLQYQIIEAEMVPMLDADTYKGLPAGNKIRSGIELDKRGRRVAYWVHKEHPNEKSMGYIDPGALVRVLAGDMIHVFEPLRAGQLRGVSMLAPILTRLRNIENYDDATLTRQQLANLIVAFITRKLPPLTGDEDINGMTGEPYQVDETGTPLAALQPGLVQELDDGQEVTWSNPPEAGTNYSDYMRTQHMGTAAGTGLPYELFSGDIKEVSDRTLRIIINDFRRHAEQRQWQIIIPQFCQRTLEWFVDAAVLAGKVSVAEADLARRVEWATHGWAHIHPVQDPQGKQLEVDAGFRSRSSVIADRGDDPDEVDAERAADKKRAEDLGLSVDPAAAAASATADQQQQSDQQQQQQQQDQQVRALAILASLQEQMRGQQEAMQAAMAALNQKPADPVQLTINNHIPQTVVENSVQPSAVTVQNNIEPTPLNVSVQNNVEPTPLNVSVAAPTVEVHNDVQPAEVNVNIPARKTDTTIVRDSSGNIVRATQIETDADPAQ
jgi:lambda family phage portal protein